MSIAARRILAACALIAAAVATGSAAPQVDTLPRLPPLDPEAALRAFRIADGYRIGLAACEPEVVDPVALSFDSTGALYVAEMRDYSERRAEKLSRVRRLIDRDGDGRFESSTVFMEGLAWVAGVLAWKDRVFVLATPDLWVLRDTDGDGIADKKNIAVTGFGDGAARLNVQALANSLTLGPDGRIWCAVAANGGRLRRVIGGQPGTDVLNVNGRDVSFDPETLSMRGETGGGQYGQTFDHAGRRYVCSNSRHLVWAAPGVAFRGFIPPPPSLVDIPVDGPSAPVFRLSPEEPWRVLRTNWRASGVVPGIVEGGGRASGYFTSACGIHWWRNQFIVADIGSNLVHRKRLRETSDGPVAERVPGEEQREFLASTDTWFRPVSFATAPDGSLLIADMCREYVEHPDSLPPELKQHMDLNSGNDRGRIWRIRPPGEPVPAAAAPLPWINQVQLIAEKNPHAVRPLAEIWRSAGATADGRLGAMILASLPDRASAEAFVREVKPADLAEALTFSERLGTPLDQGHASAAAHLAVSDSTAGLRLRAITWLAGTDPAAVKQIALSSRESLPARLAALRAVPAAAPGLLDQAASLPLALRAAVIESLEHSRLLAAVGDGLLAAAEVPAHLAQQLRSSRDSGVASTARKLLPEPPADRTAAIAARLPVLNLPGDGAKGRDVFLQRCAVCHRDGPDGFAVGPDRASFAGKGKPVLLASIIDPHKEVAPQFSLATAVTAAGDTFAGVLAEDSADLVRLRLPGGAEQIIPRRGLRSLTRSALSLMPVGVEEGLTDSQFADLLAFLTGT